MSLNKQIGLAALASALAFPGLLLAEARISSCAGDCKPASVSAGVLLKIVIPDVIGLDWIGPGSSALNGNGNLKVTKTYAGKSSNSSAKGGGDAITTYTVSKP